METQLEKDFVRWLHRISCDVVERHSRRFEDSEGYIDDREYCVSCVEEEQRERVQTGSKFIEVRGSNESIESDIPLYCDRCNCMLSVSPTSDYVKSDIECLSQCDSIYPELAWSVHNWMDGMGDYDRDDWKEIAPHAARLMEEAGEVVVPDGFITFCPAIRNDWYEFDSVWLGIYQWFAEKLIDWMKSSGEGGFCYLIDTSGIGHDNFRAFPSKKTPSKVIWSLLNHVGMDCGRGRFLKSIGLESSADFEKPIRMKDQRCDWPQLDVRGRVLKKSHNKSHPKAKTLTNSEIGFCKSNRRWYFHAYYDYNHYARSSWCVSFYQKNGQSLADFTASVNEKLESLLVPCNDPFRSRSLQKWDSIRSSLEEIFYFDLGSDDDITLTDLLTGIKGTSLTANRIRMNKRRVATLKRWIESSRKEG